MWKRTKRQWRRWCAKSRKKSASHSARTTWSFRNVVYRRLPDRIYVDYFFGSEFLPAAPRIVEQDKITELGYFSISEHRDEIVPYVFMALNNRGPYLDFDETGRPDKM